MQTSVYVLMFQVAKMSCYIILNLFFVCVQHCFKILSMLSHIWIQCVSFNHCLTFHQMNILHFKDPFLQWLFVTHFVCPASAVSSACGELRTLSVHVWGKRRQPPPTGTVADLAAGTRSLTSPPPPGASAANLNC